MLVKSACGRSSDAKKVREDSSVPSAEALGPVHTKTIVNANASKHKFFYAFRPPVHTKMMKMLTVNA